jgi:hypothetical protein
MRTIRWHFHLNKLNVYRAPFIVAFLYVLGLGYASAKNIIAPYDAIVCFDSDFTSCLANTNANLSSLYDEMFEESDGKPILHPGLIAIPGSNTTVTYNEKTIPKGTLSYQCRYGTLYEPNLKVKSKRAAVYVSIPLFIILRNNLYKLQQAQEDCHNLIVTFNFEAEQIAAKKQLLSYDSAAEYLSNIVQWETYQKEAVGATAESAAQQAAWKELTGTLPTTTENDALLAMRELGAPQRALIKDVADDNMMMYYAAKFASAQREIYSYEREVEGDLYLFDVGTVDLGGRSLNAIMVPNGSWVTKGTVVGTTE